MNSVPRASETVYFQNVAGKLLYHPAGYIRMAWSGEKLPLETLQAYYDQALKLMLVLGAHKVLSDHANRAPLTAASQTWLTENWIPRAIAQAGFNYCAIVDGVNPMHRLSTQTVVSGSPEALTYKRFDTVEEAEVWLRSVK